MSFKDPLLESNLERATSPLLESTPAPLFEKENDDERMDGCEPKEDATDAPFMAKRRKKTSKVWEDFKTIVDRGVMKAECIYCKHRLSMNKSGCTTHLGRHAGGCTAKVNKLRGKKKISLALATAETIASVQNFEYNQSKVREAFAHMVIVHELPFNVAEYELFNNFARTLTPHWQKISRFTLKKDCITTFELEKKKLKEELKHVDRISVTTDLWKSDQTVSYMVITRHYVDSNWNLQKRTLDFCDVPPPHTRLIMSDVLHKCFVEWGIEKKVWTITMDNATNNDAAVRLLKENLSYSHTLPLGGDIFHVRCCAHILNILVKYGLSAIEDAISKERESVKHIIASETRINMFSEITKQLRLSNKKLVLDCCTRWNATYFMLSAALEFKDIFPRYQLRDSLYKSLPSEEEWKKVSVSHLFDVGSEYPTANLFLPELVHIKKLLKVDEVVTRVREETEEPNETFMQEMVKKMKKRFDKYWRSCNLLISMAAALDPRNKMKYIEWCARNVYSEVEGIQLKVTVRGKLYSLYNEYVEAYKKTSIDDQVESLPSSSGTKGKGKRLRSDYEIYMQSVDSIDEIKSELDLYFEEGVVVWKEETDFDAILWWKMNNLKFRILSKMACDVLAIPITIVASESAFSAGGRVIDPQRSSLGVDTVQMLLCTEDWLRAHYGIKGKAKEKDDIKFKVVDLI